MAWECWRIVYQVRSPVHIGFRTIGNTQLTRCCIPGRNFWGAATARLASLVDPLDYSDAGNFVRENIVFSYFYPSVDPETPYLPEFNSKKGWIYGGLQQGELEFKCIGSIAGTAISGATSAAAEGSLHEVEYINPCWKTDESKPVLFTGFLLAKKDAVYKNLRVGWQSGELQLRKFLSDLSVGGERRYGFGRLQLRNEYCRLVADNILWNNWAIDLENNVLKVRALADETPLLAHCLVAGVEANGDLEPVIGREWTDGSGMSTGRGAGRAVRRSGICWVPASRSEQVLY